MGSIEKLLAAPGSSARSFRLKVFSVLFIFYLPFFKVAKATAVFQNSGHCIVAIAFENKIENYAVSNRKTTLKRYKTLSHFKLLQIT